MLFLALLLLVVFAALGWFVAKAFFIGMVVVLLIALVGSLTRRSAGRHV